MQVNTDKIQEMVQAPTLTIIVVVIGDAGRRYNIQGLNNEVVKELSEEGQQTGFDCISAVEYILVSKVVHAARQMSITECSHQ